MYPGSNGLGHEYHVISIEQAKEHVRDLTPREVRDKTVVRLMGDETIPVEGGYFDEPGEDLVIQLLRADDLDWPRRSAILKGCSQVYADLWSWLAGVENGRTDTEWAQIAVRLCRTVDIAAPRELEGLAESVLLLAVESDVTKTRPQVLKAAVRAAMAYIKAGDDEQVPLWDAVLNSRHVAAYGFNALLKINPRAHRIEQALKMLLRKQITEEWPVDTLFLMRSTARERGSEEIVARILSEAFEKRSQSPEQQRFWDSLSHELVRRNWSRNWIALAVSHRPEQWLEKVTWKPARIAQNMIVGYVHRSPNVFQLQRSKSPIEIEATFKSPDKLLAHLLGDEAASKPSDRKRNQFSWETPTEVDQVIIGWEDEIPLRFFNRIYHVHFSESSKIGSFFERGVESCVFDPKSSLDLTKVR